jgi:hypothetical protein
MPVGPIRRWRYPDVLSTRDAAMRMHVNGAAFVSAARRAGVAPTWTVNFVHYWDAESRELVHEALLARPENA